jgi:hypothetical protein
MEKAGLKKSTADACLLYRTHEDNFLYIEIYVDDGLVVGINDEEIEVFLGLLQEKLARLGASSECRLSIDLCEPRGVYEQDTEKVKCVSTPASREESDNHKDVSGKVPYREAVGSLMYLAAAPRSDIAFVANKAPRVVNRPAE